MSNPQRTPSSGKKKKKKGSFDLSSPALEQFSPVAVSPGRSPLSGQLTGIPRKVKDSVADVHNLLQKWDNITAKSALVITKIANLKLEAIFALEQAENYERTEPVKEMPQEMEPLCDKLLEHVSEYKKIVKKLESIAATLHNVAKLDSKQNFDESFSGEWEPLFQTWETYMFGESVDELVKMYKQESDNKELLAQNVAHLRSRNEMVFFTAAWPRDIYVESEAKFILEQMLHETGFRS